MEWINADVELPEPIDLMKLYYPKKPITEIYYLVLVERIKTGERSLYISPYIDDRDCCIEGPHWDNHHISPDYDKVIAWARIPELDI